MTKRKLDNVELADTASSSNDQKIDYNKNNIEKILYRSTNKNIEVFLGYLNEPKQDTLHYSTTDELIEQAKLYISKQSNDAQYYLVVNLNKEGLVDGAYLAYLHYSNKRECWKCSIIPLIDYRTIDTKVVEFLTITLEDIKVEIYNAQKYYDLSITSGNIEQVIEYAKLRIKYLILNKDNLKQYESELNNIKLAEYGTYTGGHQDILKQFTSNIETIMKETYHAENTTQYQLNSTNADTKDYNNQYITSLTGEYNES